MTIKIEASEKPLQKVFSSDYDFFVPLYQRPYAWTIKEAGELLSDLVDNMGVVGTSIEEINPYFLGSIVLVKGETPRADVVDGQQRLTTLTILFSSLRPLVTQVEADGLTALLYETANPILGTTNRYRLTLRKQDAGFFQGHVQDADGMEKLRNLGTAALVDSRRNIRENSLLFLKELEKLSPSQRSRLAQFAARRCFLVVVSTPDFDAAYRIFTVLNSRGLDLTYSDILKAELIGSIHPAAQETYALKWEATEDAVGRDDFQDLFAHIRMIYRKTKMKETLLEEYRKYVVPPGTNAADFIDNVMQPFADAYAVIKKEAYDNSSGIGKINELLGWLNRIDNFDWMPSAIIFMSRNMSDAGVLEKFLKDLERLAAALMMMRSNVNERISRYARLLAHIEQRKDLYAADSPLQLDGTERQGVITLLNGDLYHEGKIRLYVLLRLDSDLSTGTATYDHAITTVEHVLPQTPEINSVWTVWFPTEEIRQRYVHKLSNLVLLARKKNSQAQNYDFDVKKQKYFSTAKGISPFALTTQVLAEKEWTPAVLDARQIHLVDFLKKLWNL
jgi:hypothetical protein